MTVTAELRAIFSAVQTGANDLGGPLFKPEISKVLQLASGTGANQADQVFTDTRTLAASATESLDLAGGLTDALGAALTGVELVGILVTADAGNTNKVVVGGAASNAVPLFGDATDTFPIPPGGFFYAACGGATGLCAITAATGDLLKITNSGSGTAVTYTIALLMRSA